MTYNIVYAHTIRRIILFVNTYYKYYKKISKWNNSNEIIDELVDILKNKTVEIHSDFVLCRIIDTLDEYNTDYYRVC